MLNLLKFFIYQNNSNSVNKEILFLIKVKIILFDNIQSIQEW